MSNLMVAERDFILQLEPKTTFISAASFKLKNILLPDTESKVGLPSASRTIVVLVAIAKFILTLAKFSIKQVNALRGTSFSILST